MRVMGAAALGLAQKSDAAKCVDKHSDSSLLFRAPAASLTPLLWVNDVTCDLEVLTTCAKSFYFIFN